MERDDDFQQYSELFSRNNITYRKQNGVTWYPISIVSSEIGLGEYLSIDIERTTNHNEPHQFSGGKIVSLFSNLYPGEAPLPGTIKVLGPNKLRVTLSVDELPDWCDDGKLGINLSFDEASYREMDFALDKVLRASGNRLAAIRDVVYNNRIPEFEKIPHQYDIEKLNASQNEAVRKILSAKDIAIIHGPPGTGKTTTLVQAIKQVLKTEKQVLVCSPSNTAVDLLTEKLHREGVIVLRLGNPARVSEDVLSNTLDAKVAAHDSYKELKNYRKTADEYFRMAGKYKRTLGREEREQRQLFYQEGKKILQEARVLEDYMISDQFDKSQVIACTPVVSSSKMMRDRQFTTVFIDEAAQALEPMSWIPITRSDRVIFAGDHFQLPPTVKSKRTEAAQLKETLFEKAMKLENASIMLNMQYRMHEHIMHFSNRQFYDENLLAAESVKHRLLSTDEHDHLLNTAVTYIDTAGCGYNEKINPESFSISNEDEAHLLLKHLKLLLHQYNPLEKRRKEISVGIISPYKEQVQLIVELIANDEELQNTPIKIVVKTVDGFQGQERDVIYISLVRSNDSKEIGFLNDIRRMNVALTRAKSKLVVIGDSSTLANHPFYKGFIDYTEEIQAYVSAWDYYEG